MFSSASFSSISFATVTPSLVIVGEPNFLSMTTFRPLGPRVTFTASASLSTPRLRDARASLLNWRSFAAIGSGPFMKTATDELRGERSGEHGQDVGLAQNEQRFAIDRDFGAAVPPKQDLVADLHFHRDAFALLKPPGADGENLALLRLLLGSVRDEEAAAGLF